MSDDFDCQIYLITPSIIHDEIEFLAALNNIASLGVIASLQIRQPNLDKDRYAAFCAKITPIMQQQDIAVMLCDHVDLVERVNADGVHLEQDCTAKAVKAARKTLGNHLMLGVSCGASRHLAMEVGEAGADYVSFGPVFDSKTKKLEADPNALDTLLWWNALMELPSVAVGGINDQTISRAIEHKADFVAVIDYVWSHPEGPTEAIKTLHQQIERI